MNRREFFSSLFTVSFIPAVKSFPNIGFKANNKRAVYLAAGNLENMNKANYLWDLIKNTKLNAIVIDVKDSAVFLEPRHLSVIRFFKERGVYIIARLVVFQDSYLAKRWPNLAIKTKSGDFWRSGKYSWNRFWMDPADSSVADYNIGIAKRAIDAGAEEINFDYIRFPSDGNMHDIVYPAWNSGTQKFVALERFFEKLRHELKKHNPDVALSIDMFGYAFMNGLELSIGQRLAGVARYFDVISPMAYPSHYKCKEFGLEDPNTRPYIVYRKTLEPGLKQLREIEFKGEVRPWIQDFSIANIYGCGSVVYYGREEIKAQIRALEELDLHGFMLWNAKNNYTKEALME